MNWFGILSLIIILCYSSFPGKVTKLEKKVKKLELKNRGEIKMSKLMNDLVGKKCRVQTEDAVLSLGNENFVCDVLDADEEWMKVTYVDKKKGQVTKIIRIDTIKSIDIVEE